MSEKRFSHEVQAKQPGVQDHGQVAFGRGLQYPDQALGVSVVAVGNHDRIERFGSNIQQPHVVQQRVGILGHVYEYISHGRAASGFQIQGYAVLAEIRAFVQYRILGHYRNRQVIQW